MKSLRSFSSHDLSFVEPFKYLFCYIKYFGMIALNIFLARNEVTLLILRFFTSYFFNARRIAIYPNFFYYISSTNFLKIS
jgi:hypothetical protein